MIDSVKIAITLTEERKQSIYTLCQNILSNYEATIRELAQTIGMIVSSELFHMAKCIIGNWKNAKYRKAYISEEAANELKWWIRNLFEAFAPIKLPRFTA